MSSSEFSTVVEQKLRIGAARMQSSRQSQEIKILTKQLHRQHALELCRLRPLIVRLSLEHIRIGAIDTQSCAAVCYQLRRACIEQTTGE